MKKSFIVTITIMMILSCTTPYQSVGITGGYENKKIDETTYYIRFRGNGLTSKYTVEEYAKKRAAEIGIRNGYRYFIIFDSDTDEKLYTVNNTLTKDTYGKANLYRNKVYYDEKTVYRDNSIDVDKYASNIYVKYFFEKPDYDGIVYDSLIFFPGREYELNKKKEQIVKKSYIEMVNVVNDEFDDIQDHNIFLKDNNGNVIICALHKTANEISIVFIVNKELHAQNLDSCNQVKILFNDIILDSANNDSIYIPEEVNRKNTSIGFVLYEVPELNELNKFQFKIYGNEVDYIINFDEENLNIIRWFLYDYLLTLEI